MHLDWACRYAAWLTLLAATEPPAVAATDCQPATRLPSRCPAGDKRTAVDAREFLLRWFDRFPQYRPHKFWLSGESYAGHCEPGWLAGMLPGWHGMAVPCVA